MKNLSGLVVSVVLFVVAQGVAAEGDHVGKLESRAFVGVTVIDGSGTPPQPDMTVLITGDRISAVGKSAIIEVPSDANQIDGRGQFMIPGLWDMHVHLTDSTEIALPALVANGVTGVRDMGGDLETLDRWREEIASGKRLGPRIYRTGPYVDGPKEGAPFRLTVTNPKEAREAVETLGTLGVDLIKVHNAVPRDAYFALAEAAQKAGIPFAGHVPKTVRPAEASDAGQKSIEHVITLFEGTFTKVTGIKAFKEQGARELFARFAKNETWVTPTLIAYRSSAQWSQTRDDPRRVYIAASLQQQWARFFRVRSPIVEKIRMGISDDLVGLVGMMHEEGVQLLAGTDLALRDIFPGFSLHDELALLVNAGLTPMEALQAATIGPARFLGVEDSLGTVEEGKFADLVLLEEDPLENIGNTQKIASVVVRGRFLEKSELESLLGESQAAAPSH
jgi:imidazolonepropionase-like amidohydrolase